MPELTKCSACEHPVSVLAATCPNCGHPLREAPNSGRYRDMQLAAIKHRLGFLIFCAIVIGFLTMQALR